MSTPSGADGLGDAIANAECVKPSADGSPWEGPCNPPLLRYWQIVHPECAEAAALAWFTDWLEEQQRKAAGYHRRTASPAGVGTAVAAEYSALLAELGGDQRETGEPT